MSLWNACRLRNGRYSSEDHIRLYAAATVLWEGQILILRFFFVLILIPLSGKFAVALK